MKVTFALPTDGKDHAFCLRCHSPGVELQHNSEGGLEFYCDGCGFVQGRCLYIGKGKFWIDQENTFWHESGGVFVRRNDGKFLFFERTSWPAGLTIPSGHIDRGETGLRGAIRELREEVGIDSRDLTLIDELDIEESCNAGADHHHWHVYLFKTNQQNIAVVAADEGRNAQWLSLEEALARTMTDGVRHIILQYQRQLQTI